MAETRNLAVLLFKGAELLDFCGPIEVFSVAAREMTPPAFEVLTVAEDANAITTRSGLSVVPDLTLADCPSADILLVPGGIGTRQQIHNQRLIDWIEQTAGHAELVLSVCTGALLLGRAGLLEGLEATTHNVGFDLLREIVPTATLHENRRFVDNGKIITSAGIAAGIDMSLHVVDRLLGRQAATATAKHMEYPYAEWLADAIPKPDLSEATTAGANENAIGPTIIESAAITFRANKGWADQAIAQLPDDKLHIALDENTNSIAVIMKHVAGNLLSRWTDFLTTDGEKPWRNRDEEFVDSFQHRGELIAYWEQGWDCLFAALGGLTPEDLYRSIEIRGEPHSVPLAIQRSLAHCAYHAGQIIMIVRVLAADNWQTISIPRGKSAIYNQTVWGKGHFPK